MRTTTTQKLVEPGDELGGPSGLALGISFALGGDPVDLANLSRIEAKLDLVMSALNLARACTRCCPVCRGAVARCPHPERRPAVPNPSRRREHVRRRQGVEREGDGLIYADTHVVYVCKGGRGSQWIVEGLIQGD